MLDAYADSLFRIEPYKALYLILSTGIRASRLRLYPEKFFTIPIVIPPVNEQRQIVHWIENETQSLGEGIARAQREIMLTEEFRIRLIADVVTGKLDVREAAAKLPEPPIDTAFEPEGNDVLEETEVEESDE